MISLFRGPFVQCSLLYACLINSMFGHEGMDLIFTKWHWISHIHTYIHVYVCLFHFCFTRKVLELMHPQVTLTRYIWPKPIDQQGSIMYVHVFINVSTYLYKYSSLFSIKMWLWMKQINVTQHKIWRSLNKQVLEPWLRMHIGAWCM